jgi:hypothetical protein
LAPKAPPLNVCWTHIGFKRLLASALLLEVMAA